MTTHRHGAPTENRQRGLSGEVVIVQTDPAAMMRLSAALASMRYKVTAIDALRAIDAARSFAEGGALSMIVALDGSENVLEIRSLLGAATGTHFLFLAPEMPPRAPVARILNAYGAAILHHDEAPVVVVSTLVALLSREPYEVR